MIPDARPHAPLPPVDAPLVPGGGPAALPWFDRRATAWIWLTLAALAGVAGGYALLLTAMPAESTVLMLTATAIMVGGVALGVLAARRRHSERHDRVLDDATVYATGAAVDLEVGGRDDVGVRGDVRRDGRPIAILRTGTREGLVLEVGPRTLHLERRAGATPALRAVDRAGRELLRADGHRAGDLVDWVLAVPGATLRLRQDLATIPSRRTVLDAWGRAWATTDDVDLRRWTAQLPVELDEAATAFALVLLVHVDSLGVEHCHGHAPREETWRPWRSIAVRPVAPRWNDED